MLYKHAGSLGVPARLTLNAYVFFVRIRKLVN